MIPAPTSGFPDTATNHSALHATVDGETTTEPLAAEGESPKRTFGDLLGEEQESISVDATSPTPPSPSESEIDPTEPAPPPPVPEADANPGFAVAPADAGTDPDSASPILLADLEADPDQTLPMVSSAPHSELVPAQAPPPPQPAKTSRNTDRQEVPLRAEQPSARRSSAEVIAGRIEEETKKEPENDVFYPKNDVSGGGMPTAKQDDQMPATASNSNEESRSPAPVRVDRELIARPGNEAETATDPEFADLPDAELSEFFGAGSSDFRESIKEQPALKSARLGAGIREAARETVLVHALQLKDLGRSHLDVAFRPDEDTLITLHLQTVNGEIVVEGRLDQGGNQELLQDWNRLQRTLARDGVQLRNLDFNHQGQRESAGDRRDPEANHPPQPAEPGNGREAAFLERAFAADAAPFPGVAVSFDTESTWQAWG